MLTFPQVLTHGDFVVFPDDESVNLFYLLNTVCNVRMAGNVPVFRAVFWTDAADGASGSVAGLRGGMLNFDVNLAVPPKVEEEIKRKIEASGIQQSMQQEIIRNERERLVRMARAQGQNPMNVSPRVPEIGEVRFGSIQFLKGNVTLLERQGNGFVEWHSAGGPPSLLGSNNAAFAMRLGAEGAAVWLRALEQNAAAIGIRYELTFEARLPSLEIHMWAGSHQKLEITRKAERVIKNMDQGCSDADVERIDVKEVTERLEQEGLIHIDIKKGSSKISDEHVSQLRTSCMNLMSDRVKEIIMNRIRGMTEEERKSSLLGKVEEEINAFAELRLTQRDVIEWQANPQATIADFFGGLDEQQRKRMMAVVDLSDPVVSTLEVPVTADANWDDLLVPVTRVDVFVEYPATKEGVDKIKAASFDKGTAGTKQILRWRRERRDRGGIKYWAKAYLKGARDPILILEKTTNGPVHIQVPAVGRFKVVARPHPDMFSLKGAGEISAVELDYEYKTAESPDYLKASALVTKDHLANGLVIEHVTMRAIDAPVRVRVQYLRKNGPAIPGPESLVWIGAVGDSRLDLPLPWKDFLRVGILVPPGIKGLKKVRVEMQHQDPSGFQSDALLELDQEGEWTASTELVQNNKDFQRFRYRYTVLGDDQSHQGPWVEAEGDQQIILPVLGVQFRLDHLKIGQEFSEAIVRCRYDEPERNLSTREEFFLTKDTPAPTWLVPRGSPTSDVYKVSVRLIRPTGEELEVPEFEGRGTNLILRPIMVPVGPTG